MASRLEDDRGSVNVSLNLFAMMASGVLEAALSGRPAHLLTRTRRA